MKKKIYLLLTLVIIALSSVATPATAQNRVFEKYSDMDDVEYICITKSMLKLISPLDGNISINGVNIKGVTDNIKILVIISSSDAKACKQMKEDFRQLKSDSNYEVLMYVKDNDNRITTLFNEKAKEKELVMYIDEDDEQTYIVLCGNLTEEMINKILSK